MDTKGMGPGLLVVAGLAGLWLWSKGRTAVALPAEAAADIKATTQTAKASGASPAERLVLSEALVTAQAPEQITAAYTSYAKLGIDAAGQPSTGVGVLANAYIKYYESLEAGYADAAMVGERIYGTATGGVSLIGGAIADSLLATPGVTAKSFDYPAYKFTNFYYNGQLIAKAENSLMGVPSDIKTGEPLISAAPSVTPTPVISAAPSVTPTPAVVVANVVLTAPQYAAVAAQAAASTIGVGGTYSSFTAAYSALGGAAYAIGR